jgi:hypothetical protein
MKVIKWMNDLAIRGTYGITGNSPYTGAAALYDILGSQPQSQSGGVAGDALVVSQPANNKLSWETTRTVNIGIDYTLLDRKISGSIEYYHKTTTDLINNTPLNPFSGFTSITGNLGRLLNHGIEMSLMTVNVRTRHFSWTTNFTFSYNKNKLASYPALSALYSSSAFGKLNAGSFPGYSLSPLFAYKFAGLDSIGDPRVRLADKTVTKNPNISQASDLIYKGTIIPLFNGGFSNTFSSGGFSLTVNMIYNMGNVMRRDFNTFYTGRLTALPRGFSGNVNEDFADRWKKPGDEAFTNIPSYVANQITSATRRNISYYEDGDINVVSASYIKIRDITLSYDLQPRMLRSVRTHAVRVFAQATNFMVWKANHYGIDPEYISATSGIRSIPPYQHSFSLGANVTL